MLNDSFWIILILNVNVLLGLDLSLDMIRFDFQNSFGLIFESFINEDYGLYLNYLTVAI